MQVRQSNEYTWTQCRVSWCQSDKIKLSNPLLGMQYFQVLPDEYALSVLE